MNMPIPRARAFIRGDLFIYLGCNSHQFFALGAGDPGQLHVSADHPGADPHRPPACRPAVPLPTLDPPPSPSHLTVYNGSGQFNVFPILSPCE